MALHLKDRVMEQKLNELSNGEFSKILNKSDMKNPNCICFTIDKKEDIELSVFLRPEAIEPEYDPHAWNEYPDVTPPFDKDMRVELDDGLRYCARYHKFSDGCFWVSTNGTCFPNYLNYKVVRFRPWSED